MAEPAATAEHTLEIRRVFSAPRDVVFKAWSEAERFSQWWGPAGMTAILEEFDVRPGGAYRLEMRGADGIGHWLHGTFHEVVAPERLVYSWVWEQGDLAGREMLVTVDFRPVGDATEIHLTHALLPSEGAVAAHKQGWSSTLDCFADFLERR